MAGVLEGSAAGSSFGPWGAIAGGLLGGLGGLLGGRSEEKAARKASRAAQQAGEAQLGHQQSALDFLMERDQVPAQYQQAAIQRMGGNLGISFDAEGNQIQDTTSQLQRLQGSPIYQAIMAGQQTGEEALLRSASATGGLRSGNVQANLAKYGTQLQTQASLAAYQDQERQMSQLVGLQGHPGAIAQQMNLMGSTQGQMGMGQAQMGMDAARNRTGNIMGGMNMGLQAYDALF